MTTITDPTAKAARVESRPPNKELPELGRLQTRIVFERRGDPTGYSDARFADVGVSLARGGTASDGSGTRYASLADAVAAAKLLSAKGNTMVAVVRGSYEKGFSKGDNAFVIAPMQTIRQGTTVRGPHVPAGTVGSWKDGGKFRLTPDLRVAQLTSRDLSEIRYVMWNESVQAIVDGARIVQREGNASWSGLPPFFGGL